MSILPIDIPEFNLSVDKGNYTYDATQKEIYSRYFIKATLKETQNIKGIKMRVSGNNVYLIPLTWMYSYSDNKYHLSSVVGAFFNSRGIIFYGFGSNGY